MDIQTVTIEKLVHGGQGIATLADGRRVFVWGVLPGEVVTVQIRKQKRQFVEAIIDRIDQPSPDRLEPRDEVYLSTSPWQIMSLDTENTIKRGILAEAFEREYVVCDRAITMQSGGSEWHYRNKMEYSFYGDDAGLHLALFNRGSHGKRIITGSSIAMPVIDETAHRILRVLRRHNIRGSQLKTVMMRADQRGDVVAALFVKDETFPVLADLADVCQGIVVCYSTPKSPASVMTRTLYQYGDITLVDLIDSVPIRYDVHSFFQVNIPVFHMALAQMRTYSQMQRPLVDMYAGVGTIGLPLGADKIVEIDGQNIAMAKQNCMNQATQVIAASAEQSLDHIPDSAGMVIVDPPRAGLHTTVTERLLAAAPSRIAYLSCNPSTQARDLALLQSRYVVKSVIGYNFFPKTPHIESLALLEVR